VVTDAVATVKGQNGASTLPITSNFSGPGSTSLAPDELLTQLTVPVPLPRAAGVYIRHMPRKELDIAIAGVGVYIQLDAAYDKITHARVCLASVAPTPLRAPDVESALLGQSASDELFRHAGELAARASQPITDHRATSGFRRTLVRGLTQRTLEQAAETIRTERLELER
jgi:carbon-monoxide dehydrogenase medium subunit